MRDASGGAAETNSSDTVSDVDARLYAAARRSNRHHHQVLQFNFNSPLPPGSGVSSSSFTFAFASNKAAGNPGATTSRPGAPSDNALLATYGSSGSPIACASGTTVSTTTTSLPILTTTADANDLRIRAIIWDRTPRRWTWTRATRA